VFAQQQTRHLHNIRLGHKAGTKSYKSHPGVSIRRAGNQFSRPLQIMSPILFNKQKCNLAEEI
jgi:hypothetical protein